MNNLIFAMMGRSLMQTDHQTPEGQSTVADAPPDNWVDRYAPPDWRPWLRLSRADRPIGTWLLLLPCWWGIGLAMIADHPQWHDLWIAVACGAGAVLMRGAGCTWNDITDRDIDDKVARTRSRPIPSGQVTVTGALVWLAAQALAGFVILLTLGGAAILLGIASLALVAIYPFAKRFTWWPQVFLGLAFNWGAVLAYAAHAGTVTPSAILLYAAGISWTLYYDTIYAHQDKEDDALIGVKSTARLFGERSRQALWGFMGLTLVLAAAAIAAAPLHGVWQPVVALAGVWAFGWHLVWQMRRLDVDDPTSCMVIFRANRDAGLILALFLAIAAFL